MKDYNELLNELSSDERKVLLAGLAMSPRSSASYSAGAGVPTRTVRRIMGDFVERGWADLVPMTNPETGRAAGRGFALTTEGWFARQALRNGPPPVAAHLFTGPVAVGFLGFAAGAGIGAAALIAGLL